jgi:hypothetical protein
MLLPIGRATDTMGRFRVGGFRLLFCFKEFKKPSPTLPTTLLQTFGLK